MKNMQFWGQISSRNETVGQLHNELKIYQKLSSRTSSNSLLNFSSYFDRFFFFTVSKASSDKNDKIRLCIVFLFQLYEVFVVWCVGVLQNNHKAQIMHSNS